MQDYAVANFRGRPPLRPFDARGGNLDGRPGATPFCAELARHPLLRAEHTLEQRRNVEVRIELGPVQPQPRRADFNFSQIVGRRIGQPFREPRRKRQLDPGV